MFSEASLDTPVTLERAEIREKKTKACGTVFLACVSESVFYSSLKLNGLRTFCRYWMLNGKRQ